MKGVADRTLELMNEYHKEQYIKSYQSFQHFLVVKIEELEDEIEAVKQTLKKASRFNELSKIESAPAWDSDSPFQQEVDALLTKEQSNVR